MRRLLMPWSGLIVAVLTVLALVGATVPAEARAKRAEATFVYVESDPGDESGLGLTYVAAAPSTTVGVTGTSRGSDLQILSPDGELTFAFFVSKPFPQRITTGVHPFGHLNPSGYELTCSLPKTGCSSLEGSLDIRQLEFSRDGLRVTHLDMTFTGYSSWFGSGGLRGHVAYRSTRSIALPEGPAILSGGEMFRNQRGLLNAQGVDGGRENGDTVQFLTMSGDGRAVVVSRTWPDSSNRYVDKNGWSTPTAGSKGDRLSLSTSGRLSLLDDQGRSVWSVRPKGAGRGTFLVMNYDGRVMLVSARFKELWSAG